MITEDPYSLGAAARADAEGRLAEWVTTFLASPGSDNEALAAELIFHGASFLGLVRLALGDLRPLAGPDHSAARVTVPAPQWDEEVRAMSESLARGWEPPPLLVSYNGGGYVIEDGNHRHDALLRAGATHTWAILVFWDDADRSAFLACRSRDAPPLTRRRCSDS